ncbi:glycoside hydrolase [Aspergillus oleicola]
MLMSLVTGLLATAIGWWPSLLNVGAALVRDTFINSWDAYTKYAWGWIIVNSLMIMNVTTRLSDARKIHMLEGLLSAHYRSTSGVFPDMGSSSLRDYIYLSKAIDLADRIPYASVHLSTRQDLPSHADAGASSTAEAATVQLEIKYMSNITGEEEYWRKGVGGFLLWYAYLMFVCQTCGTCHVRERKANFIDLEYLVKQYLQTSGQEPDYREMCDEALAGIQKHLGISGCLSPNMDHLVCFLPGSTALGATEGLTEQEAHALPTWNSEKDQQMQLARELTKTCWAMYADLKPFPGSSARHSGSSKNDKTTWKDDITIKPLDAHNLQRTETVESLFIMYRVTNDPIYRKWGWEVFKAFKKYTIVRDGEGFTSLQDMTKVLPPKRDDMERFWQVISPILLMTSCLGADLHLDAGRDIHISILLLFSPREFLPISELAFNTEAHVLPQFNQTNIRTGWERMKRP